jgi:hypothetical protein
MPEHLPLQIQGISLVPPEERVLPEILYKYRESNNNWHTTVITQWELFLSSPSGFADEHDCNIETKPELLTSEERTAWIARSLTKQFPELIDAPTWKQYAYAQYYADYGPLSDPTHVQQVLDNSRADFNNRFGVLCLTADPANAHMWNAYAGNFSGFCIGFYPDAFDGYACGPMHYVPELPVFKGNEETTEFFANLIYVKHEQYEPEKEFRVNRFWPSSPTDSQRKIRAGRHQIAEVIIGCNAPAGFADFVRQHIPGIAIRIARPDGNDGVILEEFSA